MAGQPTKYNAKVQAKADDYVANYASYGDSIPSVAGLSLFLDVSRKTIQNWGKVEANAIFLRTLDKLNTSQEHKLLNSGLNGDFNAAITKLALCNHGYSDKPEESKPDETIKYVIVTDATRD